MSDPMKEAGFVIECLYCGTKTKFFLDNGELKAENISPRGQINFDTIAKMDDAYTRVECSTCGYVILLETPEKIAQEKERRQREARDRWFQKQNKEIG